MFENQLVKCTTGVTNAVIPLFTTCQYPTMLRTRAIGISNFSAGIALITVPYIWLLVSLKRKFNRKNVFSLFFYWHWFCVFRKALHRICRRCSWVYAVLLGQQHYF